MGENKKVTSLGALRGVAVIAVCFCHFGKPVSNGNVLPHIFNWLGDNGKYGVQIFFVISGFVIPYSLYKAKYDIKDYFKFLYKRILRLHPPYLAALFITLLLAYFSYRSRHIIYPETFSSIIKSLFYIHLPADNPVFWTLQIEAQYYIFVGLFFVLLIKVPKLSILLFIPLLLLASQTFVAGYIGLLSYIVFFLTGIIGYLIYTRQTSVMLAYAALFVLIVFAFVFYDFTAATASLLTILVILYYKRPVHSLLEFSGEISYSVYLIHFVIGVKTINYLQRYVSLNYNWLIFIIAMIISFAVAWVFWKFIEKPSAMLSNKVKYGTKDPGFLNYPLAS